MRRPALRYTASGVVAILLVTVLVIMVNWISERRWVRGDWTSTRIYTLSEKTENILVGLSEDIQVVVFMTPATGMYDQVYELLERYRAASPRIRVQYIDPDKEPLKTRQLAEQFGVQVADTVVFSAGERSKYVTSDQITEMDYSGMQFGQAPTMKGFKGEEAFTSAILSLVAPTVPKIYFVTGHGEAALGASGGGAGNRGLTVLAEMLKRENMETADVSLLSGEVPEDADVVAIVGPTAAVTEAEIDALDGYLEGGGRLLVALDPLIDPDGSMRPTRLEGFLARHGVAVGDDLVIDPSKRLPFYDLSAVYLDDFPRHPVTEGMEGFALLLTVARSVTAADDAARELVQTTDEGWGETDLGMLLRGEPVAFGGEDLAGPVSVGVVVEREVAAAGDPTEEAPAESSRLVVFGDSDFLTDLDIANAGNGILAANVFNWLGARDQQVGIPPRDVEQVSLFLTRQQMRFLAIVVLVLMPGAAIVAGILVWRRRRH